MSRDRGTSASPQHDADGDRSNRSTDRERLTTYGEPMPEELVPYDELTSKDARTVFSLSTRMRIRQAAEQAQRIVIARMTNAERPQSVATREGLIHELKKIGEAHLHGEAEDVRASYLTAAASMILLAEAADRPPELPAYVQRNAARGKK